MPTFKRLICTAEAAEAKMNKWSDVEINAVDIVILPPDNVDLLIGVEEAQDDHVKINKASALRTIKGGVKIYQAC